ncbi:MAG: sugar ABC transporter substrate-binding protein [Ornithinimicrobium sp.]|uniref:sugar ABC transporter substrate-binding protein n=1 Tax=Ornithinimicrobium sp. TaxID=1977084 RepID=UPI003D9B0D19
MKRTKGVLAVTGIAALMLSACGGESSNPAEEEPSAAETGQDSEEQQPADGAESTEAPVRDENADLVIWSDNVRAPVLQEYADQFGQEFGITAQVQVATDVRQQFKDATNVGEGPDIIVGAHDWLGELVQDGTVAPIQMSSDVESGFTPESIEATQFNGQTYGVPYSTENLALIRNTDMAPDLPATMEDLVAKGKELVDAGEAEAPMVTPVSQQGDAYHAFPYLSAYGGGIFGTNEDGGWDSQNVILDSPETIKGGEKISMLAEQGALNVSIDGTTAEALFTAGDAPFFITGPWSLPAIQDAGINYEVSPIPEFEDGGDPIPFLGVQMFYVSADAANPTLAQEFVNNYVPTPDFQMAMFRAGGRPPALQETLDAVSADNPDIEAFAESGEGAQPMPNIPAMNAVWGPLGVAEVDIVEGAPAAERLPSAQQEIVSNIE